MHAVGKKLTADVAGWSVVWNYTALAQTSLDSIITMSTYTGNFTSFQNALRHALNDLPLSRYGCGLETINESVKPNKPFSDKEISDRFKLIVDAGISEVDLWRMPIPDNWWPFLTAFVSGSPLPPVSV